jgi:hypothetical protein
MRIQNIGEGVEGSTSSDGKNGGIDEGRPD